MPDSTWFGHKNKQTRMREFDIYEQRLFVYEMNQEQSWESELTKPILKYEINTIKRQVVR